MVLNFKGGQGQIFSTNNKKTKIISKLGIVTSKVLEQICPILESILAPFTIFFLFLKLCCQEMSPTIS